MIDFTNIMKDKTAYLTLMEIDKMLQHCYGKGHLRDYMLLLTLQRTGRRVTEIVGEKPYTRKVGLRPCDVHEDGLIEFDILKKNPVRSVSRAGKKRDEDTISRLRLKKMPKRVLLPVDDEYLSLLLDYISYRGIGAYQRIFPLTRQRVDVIIKRIAKACKISRAKSKIHAHHFRHSFAISLLKKNPNDAATLKQVQDLLVHSDINVTMTYAQFTQEDKKESLNRLFNRGA